MKPSVAPQFSDLTPETEPPLRVEIVSEMVKVSYAYAKRHGVFVAKKHDHSLLFARQEVASLVLSEILRTMPANIQLTMLSDEDFDQQLSSYYQGGSDAMQAAAGIGEEMDLASLADTIVETEDLMEQEDDAPIIRLINAILSEAVRETASDIHIETFEKRLLVRMRIDGVLREVLEPRRELAPLLVSRIKVMARLDIAEKRVPQDGRISLRLAGREVDVRVSTMPSSSGERVVLRLLDKNAVRLDVSHLGMSAADSKALLGVIYKPHGIILVTGPTGSGKTTTLYASLTQLNDKTRNILTVEDPIEFQIEGVGQTQVNNKVDMTFAKGLKAMLRQDPDVVMVGEIRDLETAEIAIQASLTGHLVLSTLHTNTAVGAVTRLQDMGIEPFLIASSLVAVIAQRLVRTLCNECKQAYKPIAAELVHLQEVQVNVSADHMLHKAVGCKECNLTGYRGRTGIYEVVIINDQLRQHIHNSASETVLEQSARKNTTGIRVDGFRQVLAGRTTLEEVLRVTQQD